MTNPISPKILLAVDDDPVKDHAVRAVTDWLPPDSDVVVLYVGPSTIPSGEPAPTTTAPTRIGGLGGFPAATPAALPTGDALTTAARETAIQVAQRVDGIPLVEQGDPSPTIVWVAEEIDADLIVIGTGDRSWLSRLFEPSVSASVTRNAPCSVLIVRPGKRHE